MAKPKLGYSIGNAASTTLSSGIVDSDTSAPLTSDTNFNAKSGEGMVLLDESASTEEIAYATTKSGGALTIPLANRGLEGGSAAAHASGTTVKGVLTAGMWNDMIDSLLNVLVQSTGAVDTTKVVTLTGTQTLTNKTLTAPIISGATQNSRLDSPYGLVTTDTDGATITLNCTTTSRHEVVLGGNRTLVLSNYTSGQMVILDLIQDGTGSRTITWFQGPATTTTMTIAAPGVLTTGTNIPTGTPIVLTTTGALPTGLTASTVYWYTNVSSTTGKLSTSLANCQAGTFITTSGSQSGVHTLKTQIRWFPSQTTPTLSTGKFVYDTINIYVKDATAGVFQGYVAGQGA